MEKKNDFTQDNINAQETNHQKELVAPPFYISEDFIAKETTMEQCADKYSISDNVNDTGHYRNQATVTEPTNISTNAIVNSKPLQPELSNIPQNICQQTMQYGYDFTERPYTYTTQRSDTPTVRYRIPSCLEAGYITPEAMQRLSEKAVAHELDLLFLHKRHDENFSYRMAINSLPRINKKCDKVSGNTENKTFPLHKTKANLRDYESRFILDYAVVKIKVKYGAWQYLLRYTDSHRHVPISNQELEQTYYNFLYDSIPDDEEVADIDINNSLRRLKSTIKPLHNSGLRILKGTELMWENGIFDILTSSFTPMNPSDMNKCFNLYSIELNYPMEYKNPDGFDAVLQDMFDMDNTKIYLTYQIIGAILTPNPTRKKLFLLQGKTHGGKTRLTSLISSLMPPEDVAQLNTLSEITDANLIKTHTPIRLVNVVEVGKNKVSAKQIVSLKSFADGLDAPGMAAFKILMSTNYPIVTGENGFLEPALKIRLLTLPFSKAMSNSDPVVASYEDCTFEEEKPFIIIKALLAFREVLENNWTFCHEYPVNEVIEDNGDTTQENTTDGLTDEEFIEIQRRNNNPTVLPLSLKQLFDMRLVLTDDIDAKTSLSAQQIMDDLNSIHPESLNSREWTGTFLKRHYGDHLKSRRFEGRGTCYNLAFAANTNDTTRNEE